MNSIAWTAIGVVVASWLLGRLFRARLLLSRAKHPSLQGHAAWAKRLARFVPFYEHGEETFFSADGAPPAVGNQRRAGFEHLATVFGEREAETSSRGQRLAASVSDMQFTRRYRVPFQFSSYVASRLKTGT